MTRERTMTRGYREYLLRGRWRLTSGGILACALLMALAGLFLLAEISVPLQIAVLVMAPAYAWMGVSTWRSRSRDLQRLQTERWEECGQCGGTGLLRG